MLGPSAPLETALIAEALRIIKRKRESGGETDVSDQVADFLTKWIKEEKLSLEDLAHELIIATIFASVDDTVENKPEEEVQTQ